MIKFDIDNIVPMLFALCVIVWLITECIESVARSKYAPPEPEDTGPDWAGHDPKNLRDEFAMRAMQSQVATDMVPGEACDALFEAASQAGQDPVYRLALTSYEIADAMMEARTA